MTVKNTFTTEDKHKIKVIAIILVAVALIGISLHIFGYIRLRAATNEQAKIAVAVIDASAGPLQNEIVLPANVIAWHQATLYARTNGYLINWLVDIGAEVKKGQLLATISAPEVQQALQQAENDLKTAIANNKLAQITAVRWINLLKTNSVSKQEADEKISDAKAKAALQAAAQANRDRLQYLVDYQRVIAPFDGIIMSRTTDIGQLINDGSANSSTPLFRIVQANRLRIYVRIPEAYITNLHPNTTAQLYFREHPGKYYTAKLLTTAKAIDAATRTLLVELEIDNANYELLPGSYTQVHFIIPAAATVRLPINTLIFREEGTQVAVVNNDKIQLKNITLGRDFGDYFEVIAGIKPGELIVVNPLDSLVTGENVNVVSHLKTTKA